MKKILSLGDSNTWGYIPGTLNWTDFTYQQFPYHQRWTGILAHELREKYSLVEKATPGCTIRVEDKQRPSISGMQVLKHNVIKNEKPDLVVIMLGTNDLKSSYELLPQQITEHMDELCQSIQADSAQHADQPADILLVSPPIIYPEKLSEEWRISYENRDIEKDSTQLALCFEDLARKKRYQFCDASQPLFSDESDGLHLDRRAHQWLALELKNIILRQEK